MLIRNVLQSLLCLIFVSHGMIANAETPKSVNLYIENNQALSHPIRVYVDVDLPSNTKASLCLLVTSQLQLLKKASSTTGRDKCTDAGSRFEPYQILPKQSWQDQQLPGQPLRYGSLLLFDLSSFDIPIYNNRLLVTPILSWGESNKAITDSMISFNNGIAAILWTLVILSAFLLLVYWLSRHNENGMLGVLMTKDGRLSLSLTQMALWTLAVGTVVLGFALMGMRVPNIPDSLVWLMGFATTTSAIGHWQGHKLGEKIKIASQQAKKRSFIVVLRDLLTIPSQSQESGDLSLAKVQMLFWTVITLNLFIVKSIGDGELWSVPNELVLLMGISQGAFLTRKQMAYSENTNKNPNTDGSENAPIIK